MKNSRGCADLSACKGGQGWKTLLDAWDLWALGLAYLRNHTGKCLVFYSLYSLLQHSEMLEFSDHKIFSCGHWDSEDLLSGQIIPCFGRVWWKKWQLVLSATNENRLPTSLFAWRRICVHSMNLFCDEYIHIEVYAGILGRKMSLQ